jgi:predicted oxidoreductase
MNARIIQGCMRIGALSVEDLKHLIDVQLAHGVNHFDHADIYGDVKCEELFGKVLKKYPELRKKIILQTKCGIVKGEVPMFDSSKEHILASVDLALKRLNATYLDVLLIHRPDPLMDPKEVAEAFDELAKTKKVLHFGVSNFNPSQIELLKKYVHQPLEYDQVQMSVMNTGLIDSGINANTKFDGAIDRDGHLMDYCQLHGITLQAWSPLQYGWFEGVFVDNPQFPKLNEVLGAIAKKYRVTQSAIAIAWLLRHPAHMQVIVGSANVEHLLEINAALQIDLTRPEWFAIYEAAGNRLP